MQADTRVKIRAVVRGGLLESLFASEEIDFEYLDADVYQGDVDVVVAEYSKLPIEVI